MLNIVKCSFCGFNEVATNCTDTNM
jgi:hypothetical protein